ncbi:MAG: RNA-binding protein [Deltaproteobacteria bacterium]|nr:RNA-binding protein [Deltaproteobacteria bacterium]MBW2537074.1 RNA-binding protein [Deltaproteobacteria bacterium]
MNPGAAHKRPDRQHADQPVCRRLFVGNLDFGVDEQELRELFVEGGYKVVRATIIKDRDTGRPRGFGFVELGEPDEAAKAIEQFDGMEFAGRMLRVNPADQRQ